MTKERGWMGTDAAGSVDDAERPLSDTPRTDAEISKLESELGDGPPCISPAAIDVAVRLRLIAFARQLEREMAQAKLPVIGECEECGHKIVAPLKRFA